MRNYALVAGALVVLAFGFVLATRSDDAEAPTSSAEVTTTETVTTSASTPPSGTAEAPAPATKPAPKPAVPTVTFAAGKPKGGIRKLTFTKGDDIRFKVTSDVSEEIHVHGFDVKKDIVPGKSVTFAFPAKFDGKYEVEMEGSATQIASLEIQP